MHMLAIHDLGPLMFLTIRRTLVIIDMKTVMIMIMSMMIVIAIVMLNTMTAHMNIMRGWCI